MSIFKLDPAGYKAQAKKVTVRSLTIGVMAACAGVIAATYQQENASYDILYTVIPLIAVCVGISLWASMRRQKKMWDTYELEIVDDTITRTQHNVPTITIAKDEIQYIVESAEGMIVIKSAETNQMILIPASIAERDELIKSLADFGVLQQIAARKKNKLFSTIPMIAISLFIAFYVTKEKFIVLPAGLLLIAFLSWAFITIQRNKNSDKLTKRSSYFIFLVILSIIGRIYYLVFDQMIK
ncbi:MAG: hypothetical protein PHT07_06040 [Paludibacter sp.]|nr:hypothetical protein [Paludibacter sp.]